MTAKKAPAPSTKNFPIVCVGGSAGGLDAYIRLLQNLPADMGVAIVIVNHITALPTQLHTVLPRFTSMPVTLITDDLSIEPNHVFIIPSNRDLHVEDGEFQLKPISKPRGWPDVITAQPLCAVFRRWAASPSPKNPRPPNSPTCPKAPSTVAALTMCCRPRRLQKSSCRLPRGVSPGGWRNR